MRNLAIKYGPKLALVGGVSALPLWAQAAATEAVAAVASAQADAISVAGALVAMGVAIWGAMYLYRKFFK